jgi:DnaJ domain
MSSLDALYRTLGLRPGASPAAIKAAYRKLAKAWHPDRFADNTEQQYKAMERFKEINHAYEKLRSSQPIWQANTTRVRPRSGMWMQTALWPVKAAITRYLNLHFCSFPLGRRRPGWDKLLQFMGRRVRACVPVWSIVLVAFAVLPLLLAWHVLAPRRMEPVAAKPRQVVSLTTQKQEPPSIAAKGMRPAVSVSKPATFTVGSSKSEVLAVQGMPTSASAHLWEYRGSRVYFRNDRVTHWETWPRSPLKVELRPSVPVDTSRNYFTVGSTKDEVLAIQGTPTAFTDRVWEYGLSRVYFRNGRVTRWEMWPRSPLKAQLEPSSEMPPFPGDG